jgi:hypothetical protein
MGMRGSVGSIGAASVRSGHDFDRGRGVNAVARVNMRHVRLHPERVSAGIDRTRPLAQSVNGWLVRMLDQ